MGRHVDPWWSCRVMWDSRIRGVKVGPVELFRYRFGELDYSVMRGEVTAGWYWYVRLVGTRVTTWMDGDCF